MSAVTPRWTYRITGFILRHKIEGCWQSAATAHGARWTLHPGIPAAAADSKCPRPAARAAHRDGPP